MRHMFPKFRQWVLWLFDWYGRLDLLWKVLFGAAISTPAAYLATYLTLAQETPISVFGAIIIVSFGLVFAILFAYFTNRKHSQYGNSPLEIVFDSANPGAKFWSIEPMRDEARNPVAGSFWEYRAIVKNKSAKTVRNVKVTVESIGIMPTRPEPSQFDINKKDLIDLTPSEEALVLIRRWYNPPIQEGMMVGEGVYGPIRLTASADDVLPATKLFQFDPERTPMLYEMGSGGGA